MSSSNFLPIPVSEYATALQALYEKALEQPKNYSVNGVIGTFRVFSDLEDALKCLKRGHTLFVQIGRKFLNINFAKIPLDVSSYNEINFPNCAQEILKDILVEEFV
jgi:hypothetical protein